MKLHQENSFLAFEREWLILDRGFIDGAAISRCKRDWNIDVVIPIRKDLDVWTEAWALAALPVGPRVAAPVPAARPERLRRREAKRQRTLAQKRLTYTLRQWQLWKFLEETPAQLTPATLAAQRRLLRQWIVINWGLSYTQLPVVSFTREAMHLEGEARHKSLRKLEVLEQALLAPIAHPRPR